MFNCLKNGVLLGILLFVSACSTTHNVRMAQELHRGKSNFEAGFYRDAFRQLLPLATEGSREAQYAVGYMYFYGYGVPMDTESGVFWIQKSADQHYPPAVQALTSIRKSG